MAGKGSGRRPTKISDEEYEANWQRIFGKSIPMECPNCGEIELRLTDVDRMYECNACNAEVQL